MTKSLLLSLVASAFAAFSGPAHAADLPEACSSYQAAVTEGRYHRQILTLSSFGGSATPISNLDTEIKSICLTPILTARRGATHSALRRRRYRKPKRSSSPTRTLIIFQTSVRSRVRPERPLSARHSQPTSLKSSVIHRAIQTKALLART